jgi:glycine/D-amino acid oxidase-like deaminating enzyme
VSPPAPASSYRSHSLWLDTTPDSLEARPSLASDEEVDVAIVGAGFTGLWTAYYLKQLEPSLRVAIVEAEIAGFGASGRNGGWCLGTLAGIDDVFEAHPEGAIRLQRELFDTVTEVGRVCVTEDIDCHWARGGNVTVATSKAFHRDLQEEMAHWRALGATEDEARWMEPDECASFVNTRKNFGGIYLEPVAALHPARLVRGLAAVVEQKGVAIYERSPALTMEPPVVTTPSGSLRASTVVRATEGYSRTIPGQRRVIIPVHSMMVATAPLPQSVWDEIGFKDRATFGDPRRNVTYGQRTADGRLAFGCRGGYYYGSKIHNQFAPDDPLFREVLDVIESLFPVLRDQPITHRWGGALGIPSTWTPSVGIDRKDGFGWAGGYVGEGVGPANLCGHTLAELILERDSERTDLPIVDAPLPNWEPEPLRYIGYEVLSRFAETLDAADLEDRPISRWRDAIYERLVHK